MCRVKQQAPMWGVPQIRGLVGLGTSSQLQPHILGMSIVSGLYPNCRNWDEHYHELK
jgi:hypothetical protein